MGNNTGCGGVVPSVVLIVEELVIPQGLKVVEELAEDNVDRLVLEKVSKLC